MKELKEAGTAVDDLIATVEAADLPSKTYVASRLSSFHSRLDLGARDLQKLSAGLISVFDRSGSQFPSPPLLPH